MTGAVPGAQPAAGDDAGAFETELAALLSRTVPDPPVCVQAVERLTGGLSWETYRVEVRTGPDRRARRLVAKRPPHDGPLAPYDVAKEVAIAAALQRDGVPGPAMVTHAAGPTVAGRPVMVMEFAEGEIPSLRSVERWPAWRDEARRRAVGGRLVGLLAQIQRVDWAATAALVEALHGELDVAGQVAAVIDLRMDKIDKAVLTRWAASPAARDAWLWLGDHVPPLERGDMVIVHGDFRMGNVVWRDDRPVALLDWERACLGDPMQDLGFFCMPMARRARPELMGMLLSAGELCTGYERESGRSVDLERLHYYMIYWQFVEVTQVLNGMAYLLDRAPDGDTTSLTAYPLLSSGTVQLVELIERYEDGDHALV